MFVKYRGNASVLPDLLALAQILLSLRTLQELAAAAGAGAAAFLGLAFLPAAFLPPAVLAFFGDFLAAAWKLAN